MLTTLLSPATTLLPLISLPLNLTLTKLKDLGPLKYFLDLKVVCSSRGISLCQHKYTLDILQDSGFLGSWQSPFPMQQNLKLTSSKGALLDDPTINPNLVGRLVYLTQSYTTTSHLFRSSFKPIYGYSYPTTFGCCLPCSALHQRFTWPRNIFFLLTHSCTFKHIATMIGLAAWKTNVLLQATAYFWIIHPFHGNQINKAQFLDPFQKLNTAPWNSLGLFLFYRLWPLHILNQLFSIVIIRLPNTS